MAFSGLSEYKNVEGHLRSHFHRDADKVIPRVRALATVDQGTGHLEFSAGLGARMAALSDKWATDLLQSLRAMPALYSAGGEVKIDLGMTMPTATSDIRVHLGRKREGPVFAQREAKELKKTKMNSTFPHSPATSMSPSPHQCKTVKPTRDVREMFRMGAASAQRQSKEVKQAKVPKTVSPSPDEIMMSPPPQLRKTAPLPNGTAHKTCEVREGMRKRAAAARAEALRLQAELERLEAVTTTSDTSDGLVQSVQSVLCCDASTAESLLHDTGGDVEKAITRHFSAIESYEAAKADAERSSSKLYTSHIDDTEMEDENFELLDHIECSKSQFDTHISVAKQSRMSCASDISQYFIDAVTRGTTAASIYSHLKATPGYEKHTSIAQMKHIWLLHQYPTTELESTIHTTAEQVLGRLEQAAELPIFTTESPTSDLFTECFIPAHKRDKAAGHSETAAKAREAPLIMLQAMVNDKHRALSDQQERQVASAMHQANKSDVSTAGKVVQLLGCAVDVGSREVVNGVTNERRCQMRVLCKWEGCDDKEIGSSDNDTHLTWQLLSQFEEGGDLYQSEQLHGCLTKFKELHELSMHVRKYNGFPWKRPTAAPNKNPTDSFFIYGYSRFKNHSSLLEKIVWPKKKTRN